MATRPPTFQEAVRQIASEVMCIDPDRVTVSEDGMSVTTQFDDGEQITERFSAWLRSVAEIAEAAEDEAVV